MLLLKLLEPESNALPAVLDTPIIQFDGDKIEKIVVRNSDVFSGLPTDLCKS